MSEFINNSRKRVDQLKELILDIHEGVSVEKTQNKLTELMGSVPYSEVVQAEEELISEGFDREEVLKLCDLHTKALKGNIDQSMAKEIPAGHPLDVLKNENRALENQIENIRLLCQSNTGNQNYDVPKILTLFNELMDVDKHYLRLENLVFPFLEIYEITGPPMVLWGKHDETREFLKSSIKLLSENLETGNEEFEGFYALMLEPALKSVEEMIPKEEQILFPMCMDTLTEVDWYEIQEQGSEIGYCIYVPENEWNPELDESELNFKRNSDKIKLSTGSFTSTELEAFLNSLPVDFTFVDKDDKVKFFSEGKKRVFQRSKAILGRLVQYCHPPSSVHVVDKILSDFKSGSQDQAKFWIQMRDKFVHIAYFAVRDKEGKYLGTVEMSQDIKEYRELEGERRILNYED